MGIKASGGNVIFPDGNALKYLKEYFDPAAKYENPYTEDPNDMRTASVSPDGSVLGGNIYGTDLAELAERYCPK